MMLDIRGKNLKCRLSLKKIDLIIHYELGFWRLLTEANANSRAFPRVTAAASMRIRKIYMNSTTAHEI